MIARASDKATVLASLIVIATGRANELPQTDLDAVLHELPTLPSGKVYYHA